MESLHLSYAQGSYRGFKKDMPTVTSFHSSAVGREQIGAIMAEYLALERARIYRRLLVTRFGLLALLAIIGTGFQWLPSFASWVCVGVCVVAPIGAWLAELRCDWRLAQRLKDVPGGTTHMVATSSVRKS
jgi:uncharacterized membrane protein YcjF (UPF0283 family)